MSVHEIERRPVSGAITVPWGSTIRAALARPLADYYVVLASAAALTALGLYMVVSASSVLSMVATRSATSTGNPYFYGLSQLRVVLIGIPVVFLISRLSRRALVIAAWASVALSIALLALVVLPGGPGVASNGNRAWLDLPLLPQIQPSEFAKAAIVLWSAALFAQPARVQRLSSLRALLIPYLPVAGLILGLVVAERDMGTSVIICAIIVAQLWFAGASGKIIGAGLVFGAAGGAAMVVFSAVRRVKVIGFLATMFPFLHLPASTMSDQPQNAIYALATGGWWGVGPGASRQKWGGLYNGAHTDYILAVLGEELGLLGILVVLGLLTTLLVTGLRIARRCDSPFWRLAVSGMVGWLLVQAGINTLVAFGLLPVMGVPFPLMSYGGSDLLAAMIGVGVMLAAARHEPAARRALAERRGDKRSRGMTGVVVATRAK